ncbi:MAG: ATP-binding cassette domain-containing protein [Calditrichota bacterium]
MINKSTSAPLLFELEDFSASYQNQIALNSISLRITTGENVALIGPSGGGKTTLLKSLFSQQQEQSAVLYQNLHLVHQLSVFHNVYAGKLDYNSTFRNLLNLIRPQKTELSEIDAILVDLQLSEKASSSVGELSGGQQQRVAMARCFYSGRPTLLADEPVSSVDPQQAEVLIQKMLDRFTTVVAAMHTVDLALEYFTRVIGIRAGSIHFDIPASDIQPKHLEELFNAC